MIVTIYNVLIVSEKKVSNLFLTLFSERVSYKNVKGGSFTTGFNIKFFVTISFWLFFTK